MKKNILIGLIYLLLSVICIIAAIFFNGTFSISVLGFPYELMSMAIKAVDKNVSSVFLGWFLFVIFGIWFIPIVIISFVKHKRFYWFDLLFFLFVGIHIFALYVFVNPTLFINTNFGDLGVEVVKDNVAFMSYSSLLLWLLFSVRKNIKEKEEITFTYAKRTLYFMIGFLVFAIFYSTLFSAIKDIKTTSQSSSYNLKVVYIVLLSLLTIAPLAINIVVYFKLINFFDSAKTNLFEESHQDRINNIATWVFTYLVVAIVCIILKNLLSIIFNKELLTLKAELSIDLFNILFLFFFGCLFVFLKKSYEVKEENDLTI